MCLPAITRGNKDPGSRGIPIELLKYGGKNVIVFLIDAFNKIFLGENIAQEWYSAYICPIYIKEDKRDCNNLRCISVKNSIGIVVSRVI